MSTPQLTHLVGNVYWLPPDSRSDRPTLGVVAGERGTLLVDVGNSPAHARLLGAELTRLGLAWPGYAVLTHWHWDHVFGSALFDLPTFAHVETQRVVTEMAELDWRDAALEQRVATGAEIEFCRDMMKVEMAEAERAVLRLRAPDITFLDQVNVSLGDLTCQIIHVGGDHSADSTIVYVPEARVLFLGDCTYPAIYDGPRRLTTGRLFPLFDRLLAYEADWYVAGHHTAPMSREEMEAEARFFRAVSKRVAQGGERAEILADLQARLPGEDSDDLATVAEMFLAGS